MERYLNDTVPNFNKIDAFEVKNRPRMQMSLCNAVGGDQVTVK